MNRIVAILFSTSALLLAGCDAEAARFPYRDNVYMAGNLGASMPQDSDLDMDTGSGTFGLDQGLSGSVAFGAQLDSKFRVEGEFGYRKADVGDGSLTNGTTTITATDAGDLSVLSYMLNIALDFPLNKAKTKLKPYIMGGMGLADLRVDTTGSAIALDDNNLVLAWQLGAGLSYPLSDNLYLTTGYRYFGTDDAVFESTTPAPGFTGATAVNYSTHEVTAGFRIYF